MIPPTKILVENTSPILPVYLLCDTSSSMNHSIVGNDKPIDILNASICELFSQVSLNRETTVRTQLSIISFNSKSNLVLPMTEVNTTVVPPKLRANGQTLLGVALDLVRNRIEIDRRNWGKQETYRPVIFVLTDGHPTDSKSRWLASKKLLDELNIPPRIVPCALDEPMDGVLDDLVSSFGRSMTSFSGMIYADGANISERIVATFGDIARTMTLQRNSTDLSSTAPIGQRIAEMDTRVMSSLEQSRVTTTVTFAEFFQGRR